MNPKIILIAISLLMLNSSFVIAQQVADSLYTPQIGSKMYPDGQGTTVHIDEAHHNFHTKTGRYYTFAKLLTLDGYQVVENKEKFDNKSLREIEILVIANAESDGVTHPIITPTESAFSKNEIKALKKWVKHGGSLFLIADHMPFAGAASTLASTFGFEFYDSFVMYGPRNGTIDFSTEQGTLTNSFIVQGRNSDENVDRVRSFTGQGFKIPQDAISILNLDESQTVFLTDTMWVFNDKVERFPATGLSQGAIVHFGEGKMAVFGEAAMFSAQLAGPRKRKVGMNSKEAKYNYQLLLNIIHWLDDKLEDDD